MIQVCLFFSFSSSCAFTFRLWLDEFFGLWESIYNQAACENVRFFIDFIYYH